jgi:hypothetical protein
MKEDMQPLDFWVLKTSLKIMLSISIHLPVNDKISFFCGYIKSISYKYFIFLIHS